MLIKNKIQFFLIILLVAVSLSGCLKQEKKEAIVPMEILSDKKAALIIASQGFQAVEYDETRAALEAAGVKITVVSSQAGEATDKLGKLVAVDKTLEEINVKDFDAIAFIGGPGAVEYVGNSLALQLAQGAVNEQKVLGAICIAPEILAKAGVLKDKKATAWSSPANQSSIQALKEAGAEYVDESVVVDGKIVTANGPTAAREFGQKIVELLGL